MPIPLIDERGTVYEIDPVTGRLTFIEENSTYQLLRSVFTSVGVDIHSIATEEEYARQYDAHKDLIFETLVARALNRPSKSIDNRCFKAVLRGDKAEAVRLSALMKKRAGLGLSVVRPMSDSP